VTEGANLHAKIKSVSYLATCQVHGADCYIISELTAVQLMNRKFRGSAILQATPHESVYQITQETVIAPFSDAADRETDRYD